MTKYFFSNLDVVYFFKFEVNAVYFFVSGDDEVLSFDFLGDEVLFFKFEVDAVHFFVSRDDEVLSFDFAGDEVLFFFQV